MLELFNSSHGCTIALQSTAACVQKAANDLKRDLERLSGTVGRFPVEKALNGGIVIKTVGASEYNGISVLNEPESFTVSVTEERVYILGFDELGTVYGIYTFSEQCLGINPMHLFNDIFPDTVEKLSLPYRNISKGLSKVRFRGWFINDEDLLTDFKPNGGKRHIDYRFYQNVIHPDVMDEVFETALRCGCNLIIPSSFIDVDNPDEQKLISAAVDRGLYVTQHHVEPMGVSYFTADNYMKKRGIDAEVSYLQNPDIYREIWRYYAKLWAKYGDKVIWQLGLRGKGDRAIWQSDPTVPDDSAARGAIITNAANDQYEIICETLGTDSFLSSSTLWLEGAELYDKGHIKFPDSTVVVFSDIGINQMFGDDFFNVKRLEGAKYGIYYHVAFYGQGPHLAEGTDPKKIVYTYDLAEKYDSLYYSITNVSNIRPLHYSALFNSKLIWDIDNFDANAFDREFFGNIYGNMTDKVLDGVKRYYNILVSYPDDWLKYKCEKYFFYYHKYEDLSFANTQGSDGLLIHFDNSECDPNFITELTRAEEDFAELYQYWCSIENTVPQNAREYFEVFQKHQTYYMLMLVKYRKALFERYHFCEDAASKKSKTEQAIAALQNILSTFPVLEKGKWQGWLNGEKKIHIKGKLNKHLEELQSYKEGQNG